MKPITTEQARIRFTTIPASLQNAIFSVQTAEIIGAVAAENHLDEARTSSLADAVGWVLLGFMHPEDMAKELQENASMPPQAAEVISKSISAKIFNVVKSDIDKTYAPVPHEQEQASDAPKIIQDIGPIPMASAQKMSGPLTVGSSFSKPIPAAPAPSEKGWSKATSNDPVLKFAPTQTPPPVPRPAGAASSASASQPSFQQPRASAPSPMGSGGGEFERLARTQNAPGAAPKPPSAASSSGPGPVMLHEVSQFKTIEGSGDFHISMPAQSGNVLGSSKIQPTGPKAAMIEIGKAIPPSAPSSSAPKVVHYTDFNPSNTSGSQTGRSVSEIKPGGFTSVPVPIPPPPKQGPMPAQPPANIIKQPQMPGSMPPPPPGSSTGPSTKVITKDY